MVTVITKTIGAGGGYDYATFTAAEADVENVATTAFGSTDLVANDGAIVFEAVAGTYDEQLVANSTLTTDATRNVTYKPAAGSEHGGAANAGVILYRNASGQNGTQLYDDHTNLIGLNLYQGSATVGRTALFIYADNCFVDGCILTSSGGVQPGVQMHGPSGPAAFTLHNTVIDVEGIGVVCYSGNAHALTAINVTASARMDPGSRAFALNDTQSAEFVNCLVLGANAVTTVGTVTITGSNNFGPASYPFPPATQGTPATITASTAYDPGAGDFALYVGKNGALLDSPNNDVIDQGVGPSVNSDVPTTDILGNARSGATANPGAFEVPQATTIITKTIGLGGVAAGYDYANFTTAENNVENIGTSADLVYENEAIVFEAAAGTYNESVTFQSTLTTDATRNVTYKPAAGSEHGGVFGAGVVLHDNASGYVTAQTIHDSYMVLDGIEVHVSNTAGFQTGLALSLSHDLFGVKLRNLLLWSQTQRTPLGAPTSGSFDVGSATDPIVYENLLARKTDNFADIIGAACPSGQVGHYVISNCTFIGDTSANHRAMAISALGTLNVQVTNCMSHVPWQWYQTTPGTLNLTGSNNFGGSSLPFPASIQGTPATITPTTSFSTPLGSGDYAVYMGATGALADVTGNDVWQQGVGPASNPDVPTTDINGVTRSGTSCNPGAFEADGFVAPTVITKTIGAAGPPTYDYASFTLAETAVDSLGTGTDLTFYNEAIVFEAAAGTYNENVTFSSTLTTDATRNVTYKPAAGSEHGGVFGAGVRIVAASAADAINVQDDYIAIIGIGVQAFGVAYYGVRCSGANILIDGVLALAEWRCVFVLGGASTKSGTFRNCVLDVDTDFATPDMAAIVYADGAVNSASATFVNCTVLRSAQYPYYYLGRNSATVTGSVTNCISFANESYRADAQSGSTVTVTGSNNFGGSTEPFAPALQGTPYPITATTDVDPGPGDWAIYDAATGALIDDPDNDVLAGGIGPDANPDVPTTDIVGNTRSGATTDPGAFEISTLAPPEPALITIMRQIYQQDASFSVGASSEGVEKITHQLGPASADYFTINSTTSATVSVPRTAHALRIICVVAAKPCDVTLDLDASNSVFLGSIGGVASVQTDLTYFWSFGQVVSDGTYPRVRIVDDGFAGDQLVYLWWHLA